MFALTLVETAWVAVETAFENIENILEPPDFSAFSCFTVVLATPNATSSARDEIKRV